MYFKNIKALYYKAFYSLTWQSGNLVLLACGTDVHEMDQGLLVTSLLYFPLRESLG